MKNHRLLFTSLLAMGLMSENYPSIRKFKESDPNILTPEEINTIKQSIVRKRRNKNKRRRKLK